MFASSLLMPEAGICQLIPETELNTRNISIAENTIYTVVKITEDELYLNNNGHSDIVIYNRKP